MLLNCKFCGGELEFSEGASITTCKYCRTTQTLPKTKDDGQRSLFNRANNLRRRCDFDKAETAFEKIIEADGTEAEAYWGLVLSKYGIEYVEDPATGKMLPTCHRASYDSVISDEDYKSALEYADEERKALYVEQAREIDRIQKDILALAEKEETYDVFICYKETDESGKRTHDSVLANELYYQLTDAGYKVFYAAITLEGKLGHEYEPIIFAALNSAKVMLAVGTRPEFFNSVWVKNEWSRFLKIMKKDRKKLLIPCYRDMDAYELPDEFAHLQAQDMTKLGFSLNVLNGINRVMEGFKKKPDVIVKETFVKEKETIVKEPIINETVINETTVVNNAVVNNTAVNGEGGSERLEELLRQEAERRARRNKIMGFVVAPLICLTIAFLIIFNTLILPNFNDENGGEPVLPGGGETQNGSGGNGQSAQHTHSITHHGACEPKCNAPGNEEYWACSGCNKYFYNSGCTAEIADKQSVMIPTVSCSYDGRACIWCGGLKPSEGLQYTLSLDGKYYTVTGIGTCTDTDVVISKEYEGKPVRAIGQEAFFQRTYLTSVTMPDSITSIGDRAFAQCIRLVSISIPDSVTSIGDRVFHNCDSLTSVTIGSGVTSIASNPFMECDALESIVVSDGNPAYKSVGDGFYTKDGKVLIRYATGEISPFFVIPEGVETVGVCAFEACEGLVNITIPNGVTAIESGAFRYCVNLECVTISDSVMSIGTAVFLGCDSLTEIKFNATECADLSSDTRVFNGAGRGASGITVTFGDNVKKIPAYLFNAGSVSAPNVKTVIIGNGVESIGEGAFEYCSGIESVTIPACVQKIGHYAFYSCTGLQAVNFSGNSQLLEIGSSAFASCVSLTNITVPNSVERIGDSAFYNTGYYNDKDNWENGVLYLGKCLVSAENTIAGVYTVKDGIVHISDRAFYNCDNLTSVTIGNDVKTIGNDAFYGCDNLASVNISDGVEVIGDSAFEYCTGLTTIKYRGTKTRWNEITKGSGWNYNTGSYTLTCNYDGE